MNRSTVTLLTLSMAALSHSAASLAQEVTLEEIIVTAQKREQRLIDVPVSITALSGQELEQRGLVLDPGHLVRRARHGDA